GLYATARIGQDLPLVWAILPARLAGALFVAGPRALTSRPRLTPRALPLVVASGLAEVVGFPSYALRGRSRIAITAALAAPLRGHGGAGRLGAFGGRAHRPRAGRRRADLGRGGYAPGAHGVRSAAAGRLRGELAPRAGCHHRRNVNVQCRTCAAA